MIKKIYYWFHSRISKPEERGEYSAGHWQDAVRKKTLQFCKERKGKLLEVGCGEGLFLTDLALSNKDIQIYGIDNWKDILKKADKRLREKSIEGVRLSQANAISLPFEDSYFDVVVCINVLFNLESMDTVRGVLSEMARVCKRGGGVIFDIRNSLNPLLHFKYKLAKYYDETVRNLPLRTYRLKNIIFNLRQHNFEVAQVIPLGFPKNSFAPIFVAEARKK